MSQVPDDSSELGYRSEHTMVTYNAPIEWIPKLHANSIYETDLKESALMYYLNILFKELKVDNIEINNVLDFNKTN